MTQTRVICMTKRAGMFYHVIYLSFSSKWKSICFDTVQTGLDYRFSGQYSCIYMASFNFPLHKCKHQDFLSVPEFREWKPISRVACCFYIQQLFMKKSIWVMGPANLTVTCKIPVLLLAVFCYHSFQQHEFNTTSGCTFFRLVERHIWK